MKTALVKFATDFLEGAAAGAVTAFLAIPPDQLASAKTVAYIVLLGAIDGAVSALRRVVVAAKPA